MALKKYYLGEYMEIYASTPRTVTCFQNVQRLNGVWGGGEISGIFVPLEVKELVVTLAQLGHIQ